VIHVAGLVDAERRPHRDEPARECSRRPKPCLISPSAKGSPASSTRRPSGPSRRGRRNLPRPSRATGISTGLNSPYTETKREAEKLVLGRNGHHGSGRPWICPGLVVGPRDTKPTSTQVFLTMAANARGHASAGRHSPDRRPRARSGPPASPRIRYSGHPLLALSAPISIIRPWPRSLGQLTGRPRYVAVLSDALRAAVSVSSRAKSRGRGADDWRILGGLDWRWLSSAPRLRRPGQTASSTCATPSRSTPFTARSTITSAPAAPLGCVAGSARRALGICRAKSRFPRRSRLRDRGIGPAEC